MAFNGVAILVNVPLANECDLVSHWIPVTHEWVKNHPGKLETLIQVVPPASSMNTVVDFVCIITVPVVQHHFTQT